MELNEIFEMAENHSLIKHMTEISHIEKREVVAEIFASLVGTYLNTIDSILDNYGLSIGALMYLGFTEIEVCEILYENAMICEECGWWESPDMMDDGVCYECRELKCYPESRCPSRIPLSNADKIRAMSDEELAEFLAVVKCRGASAEACDAFWEDTSFELDWLKQEVSE